jgi:hypothetical protein
MAHTLCGNCRTRPAVPGKPWCRTCLVIGKRLEPPRLPKPRKRRVARRAMRDWQQPPKEAER